MPAIDYDPQEQNLVKILDKRILILLSLIYFSARLQSDTMSDMRIEIFAAKNWTSQGVSGILGKNSTSKAESLLENDFSSVEFNRWIHFFFGLGYMLACFPSCFAARFVQPSRWFSFLLCCSAFIGLITPHASDFGGIATLQFFSGVVLAGILPGIIVYISNFYIKEEYGIRYAGILILGDQFASIFGTLLAGAVGLLVEKSAWKWVLGVGTFISIIISIFSWYMLI